jgi:hypothetical protein
MDQPNTIDVDPLALGHNEPHWCFSHEDLLAATAAAV